jgi:hypothetical protein
LIHALHGVSIRYDAILGLPTWRTPTTAGQSGPERCIQRSSVHTCLATRNYLLDHS